MTDFDREAYIALADEFDAHGMPVAPDLTDFDPEYVAGARRFAERVGLPLPWEVRSIDIALDLIAIGEAQRADEEARR